ncbi:MAG: arabinan endo-1,5-alpha-L-arabinosidase [Reichenbachiella sp.]
MKVKEKYIIFYEVLFFFLIGFLMIYIVSCDDSGPTGITIKDPMEGDTLDSNLGDGPIDFSQFSDTYAHLAPVENIYDWAHYNVHDPSIIDNGDFFYCYSTDVAYGTEVQAGHQIRRSKNLVEWEFVGWVTNGYPPLGNSHIIANGGEPFANLWAPYVMKVGDEYRVYYSLSSPTPRLSAIGLMVSDKPYGPFKEKGLVVTSKNDTRVQTNAIDPTVTISPEGEHWFFYGSAWDGIYKLELDPATGLPISPGEIGVRIAQRGFSGNTINGNIEGPEIIYNSEFKKYYMFLAYDWLQTKYNVRVGRSDSPEGPFYDYLGRDMNDDIDDLPMILAPYRFNGHSGWQGVSHVAVFTDQESGEFYMGHQGRPGIDSYYMVLHTRQIHWTEDGWPMTSSQRYAAEVETEVLEEELVGKWEQIVLNYEVVPGFDKEQTQPGFQNSMDISVVDDGTISGAVSGTWSYESPWMIIELTDQDAFKVKIERGRDWENNVDRTILFTGINTGGIAYWGKKI